MNPPIAITGFGAICALHRASESIGTEAVARALAEGYRGISTPGHGLPYPDLHVGQVPLTNAGLRERLGLGDDGPRSRTALLALLAAQEAVRDLDGTADMAVISASTVGGMDLSEDHFDDWRNGRMEQARLALEHPVDAHTRFVADALDARGFTSTISTACSSSANAIALGARLLQQGRARRVLAGGSDALCRFTIEGFRALSAMDTEPCRPFSPDRKGMNLGEAAAYLVLERADDVQRAGRTPLAFLGGWGNSNDAHHATATSPDGDGPYAAMREAIERAGLRPEDIDHINAHGTGTANNDATELRAMERLFGTVPPFTSTKALTGHTLAAAGALEAVIAIQCLRMGLIPAGFPVAGPMPGHTAMPVTAPERRPLRAVLSSSFGFGGNCAALVLMNAAPPPTTSTGNT
ncbi:MAG: beta-ketoacyl-[acyl-carrier-protein] synthase family protein [Flavobacteriales bacterium]|nr:beta-ketoacyl-[acyl-carrier-protein] synthase family protein [Flavobacteriales bacterium]